MEPEFRAFPRIPRLFRDCVVTEKIDGTNALVHVSDDGTVRAGCRTRWITPEKDNHGFAAWVAEHQDELRRLGPGYHYGEWWGKRIQRGYCLDERRFSLFNVGRWGIGDGLTLPPACCHVVPVLFSGPDFSTGSLMYVASDLIEHGSRAAPGFMGPEGIVVRHHGGALFKYTFGGDGHKGGKDQ